MHATMNKLTGRILRWFPALLVAAAIFIFSSLPGRELPSLGTWDFLAKKGAHALGYGLLAASVWGGLSWNRKLWWLALVAACAYACTDEFHQSFTPGRHPSIVDVGIDTLGAGIAVAAVFLAMKKGRR